MSLPWQTRTLPARWKKMLVSTYNELQRLGANDVWVFGSQAMSLHMKTRALASKDLDLIATGTDLTMVRRLSDALTEYSTGRSPDYQFQNTTYDGRPYPVFSISVRAENEAPFVIELFQTFLGYEVSRLTPYAAFVKRWKNDFQTLNIEALIAARLAFRPPERITAFNARRLNVFIRSVRDQIEWKTVEEFARSFEMEQTIHDNLKDLRRRKLRILDSEKLSFLSGW